VNCKSRSRNRGIETLLSKQELIIWYKLSASDRRRIEIVVVLLGIEYDFLRCFGVSRGW